MPVGVRPLTVLGEFKPFGLIAEALEGKPAGDVPEKYDYFLFDPKVTKDRDEVGNCEGSSEESDHELFIRGNRIIWTTGSRVFKRFTLASSIIMACWSRLRDLPEAQLCVLHTNTLTIFNTAGEEVCVPLPRTVTSIWPLPFGLLLQQGNEVTSLHIPISSSSPLRYPRDISRPRREIANSLQHNSPLRNLFGQKPNETSVTSHLILKDPLESFQLTFTEERGKLSIMKEFDERTIWTSDRIPLMATYNKGKLQHTLWAVEVVNSNLVVASESSDDFIPHSLLPKQFSFRRIWQAKGAQIAASKVFLATDDDAVPVVCFLLHEKNLLSIRLQSVEINNEILFDIKQEMSWSIPAIAAAPATVTRPRVKVGPLPFTDIVVLAPDNTLLLYSGKQCLWRYSLPPSLGKVEMSHDLEVSAMTYDLSDLKIIGLSNSVEGRINVLINNGQIFRCALRRSPTSTLANDCITALSEGLSSSLYRVFLLLLCGDGGTAYLSGTAPSVDSEWESFSSLILQMCGRLRYVPQRPSGSALNSSWEFLVKSRFHESYRQLNYGASVSCKLSLDIQDVDSSQSHFDANLRRGSPMYSEHLRESLYSLHAVYETLKLDNLRKRDLILLVNLLCNVADYLSEGSYLDHYIRDFPSLSNQFGFPHTPSFQKKAPCLFRWLEDCLRHGAASASVDDLPPLICKNENSVTSWARKIISFYSLLFGAKRVEKKLSSGVYCNISPGSFSTCEELTVLAMAGERFGLQQLDLIPAGVSLPLRHALDKCRASPPIDWPAAAYVLLGREDLALTSLSHPTKYKDFDTVANVNLTSISTPYMLHLHPVIIPSTTADTIGLDYPKFEEADSTDGSLMDGMEHIFNSSTKLRYGQDLRLNEVRRLLCSAKPVAIQTSANPNASDQDFQQAQLWQLAQRTTALPLGRGAFTLATTSTLLTEAFVLPKLVLAGRLPAQQNATVNLDPNARNTQELKSWPEFHNAVAAGLRLAPIQGRISRAWIIYNKPKEPNSFHAGLLLALGLHGYLRALIESDIFSYLTQEHETTTVGLLLGLGAAFRGTMHPFMTKSLNFHIPTRHPSSYPELELPTLLQSAALVSMGLLYEGSAHTQTMQVLLGEIGRRSAGDNVLEREGYALSAGFGLGLVALGRGEVALGSINGLVNRLLQYIGAYEFHNEKSLHFSQPVDEYCHSPGQFTDASSINVDVTAPGAIIALALLFLKTESEVMLSRISVPCTHFELQYVRPDFIMLRVIARNLIMWSRIHPSTDWIVCQVPQIICDGVKGLSEESGDVDKIDAEAYVQAYVNIVAGACISVGLRFAGTKDRNAEELLYDYAVYFLNEIKHVASTSGTNLPKGLSQYVDRGTLEMCLHLIVLSLSVVMAGSGHLKTFRLLRFLRFRGSADGHANYGTQLAVSLGIGFLFLAGGTRTFSTSNSSIAALLITLYPRLPSGPGDNRCHLQAFRHLYVLATEARWIHTVDVDTGLPVYAPLEVTITETEHYAETSFCEVSPCILPERAILKKLCVCGPRYWPQVIELVPEEKSWWKHGDSNDPFNSGVLYIKRKVSACSYIEDPNGCQSLLSQAMHKVFGLASSRVGIQSASSERQSGAVSATVDQLVSTFSSDPSLIAFAQLFCSPCSSRIDADFQKFCLHVLFECVSKDRPPLLQIYVSLYTIISSMGDQVAGGSIVLADSLFISSLKLALAYNEALLSGKLGTAKDGIVQSAFLGSLRKRVEVLLNQPHELKGDIRNYLHSGQWPHEEPHGDKRAIHLSWYLKWFGVPAPAVVKIAVEKIKPRLAAYSSVPLLRLMLPRTHVHAIDEIHKCYFSCQTR